MSSPVATIFKKDLLVIDAFNHLNEKIVDIFGEEFFFNKDNSFALSFFLNKYIGDAYCDLDIEEYFSNSQVYNYSNMDSDYVDTLNEYNKNR